MTLHNDEDNTIVGVHNAIAVDISTTDFIPSIHHNYVLWGLEKLG